MSRRFALVLALALVLATFAGVASAQTGSKQIGLVIAFPDGTKHIEIVTVADTATTYDVLRAAKINLSVNLDFGPAVCGINTMGCPATNCFCDPAHYWAYYHLDPTTVKWVSAPTGVGDYAPANGAVEGLAWSGFDVNYNPTVQPPIYTFAQIVAETQPVPTPFPTATPMPPPTPQPVAVPEPGTLLLLGSGIAGLAAYVRRVKR